MKNGIKFRIENNITDDWEQLYHCIDILCEKHKARIRDIENGICKIEKFEQQLTEKEKEVEYFKKQASKFNNEAQKYYEDAYCNDFHNQDKISFAVDKLEEMKKFFLEEHRDEEMDTDYIITKDAGQIADYLLDQIKQLKGVE